MARYAGIVRHNDLEGGSWTLVTDQGVVYQLDLEAAQQAGLSDGRRAEVEGHIAADQVGFAMVGDILRVEKIRLH